MRKISSLLFASMILFSCSDSDIPADNDKVHEGLVFEIATKEQINTKAGGVMYSEAVSQSVSLVDVHAFRKNGSGEYLFERTYNVTDWTVGLESKQYIVPENQIVQAGEYKFLAIGREVPDNYTLTTIAATTNFNDFAASITNSGDEYEIFAGSAEASVSSLKGARVSLTLTRKVAGVLGYFTNVPEVIDGKTVKYLRLTASAGNKTVNLVSGTGSSPAASYHIIDIDLTSQTVTNGIYEGNTVPAGVVKLANSQLDGAYMIPANQVKLTLGLYDAAETPLKTWQVNTNADINIQANYLYTLGRKGKSDTTTGKDPDPGNPGDDDEAIDLLRDKIVTITINPEWEVISSLTID